MELSLKDKTVVISGGSRGIGKAIALKLAQAGANVVIAAKSVKEDERLGGTIYATVEAIQAAGGKGLAVPCDVRDENQIAEVIHQTITHFGGIDFVINNASAIFLLNSEQITLKQFDLMQQINVRGTFAFTQACLPYLKKAAQPQILSLSPPINLAPHWLKSHGSYTLAKYGMTMITLAWAEEFKEIGLRANTLWPKTTIDTAAVRNLLGGETLANKSRTVDIMADAVVELFTNTQLSYNGQSLIDEEVLNAVGITDFSKYSVLPGAKLQSDLFLD